jgi:hypothetical protein
MYGNKNSILSILVRPTDQARVDLTRLRPTTAQELRDIIEHIMVLKTTMGLAPFLINFAIILTIQV